MLGEVTSDEDSVGSVNDEGQQEDGWYEVDASRRYGKEETDLTRVAAGPGILCCTVVEGRGPTPESTYVKVSFVEPNEAESVMFRSKQVVHQTQVGRNREWADAAFEYEVFPPADGNWSLLEGDLLFTVYEAERNSFAGQILIPLRGLVDHDGERVRGGTQQTRRNAYALTARDGSQLRGAGSIVLQMHLELPPDEPVTPNETSEQEAFKANGDAGRKTRPGTGKLKVKKSTKASKDASSIHTDRRFRERVLKQVHIEKENQLLQKRLSKAKESSVRARQQREQQRYPDPYARKESSTKTQKSKSRQMASWKSAEEQCFRADNDMIKLSENILQLRSQHSSLLEEIANARAAISRDAQSIKRHEALQKKVRQAHEELDSREVVRKVSKATKAAAQTSSRYGISDSGLRALQLKAARQLQVSETKQQAARQLGSKIELAEKASAEAQVELNEILATLREADSRKNSKTAMLLGTASECGDAVLEIQSQEHETRVQIAVFQDELRLVREQNEFEYAAQFKLVEQLEGKLERRAQKLDAAREQSAQLESQYWALRDDTLAAGKALEARIRVLRELAAKM